MKSGNTFQKAERLSLRKRIDYVFQSGSPVNNYPLRIVWVLSNEPLETPAQILFTASSRKFKKAVDRNRIKRKLKELYRHRKQTLYEALINTDKQILVSVIYTGNNALFKTRELADKFNESMDLLIMAVMNRQE